MVFRQGDLADAFSQHGGAIDPDDAADVIARRKERKNFDDLNQEQAALASGARLKKIVRFTNGAQAAELVQKEKEADDDIFMMWLTYMSEEQRKAYEKLLETIDEVSKDYKRMKDTVGDCLDRINDRLHKMRESVVRVNGVAFWPQADGGYKDDNGQALDLSNTDRETLEAVKKTYNENPDLRAFLLQKDKVEALANEGRQLDKDITSGNAATEAAAEQQYKTPEDMNAAGEGLKKRARGTSERVTKFTEDEKNLLQSVFSDGPQIGEHRKSSWGGFLTTDLPPKSGGDTSRHFEIAASGTLPDKEKYKPAQPEAPSPAASTFSQ